MRVLLRDDREVEVGLRVGVKLAELGVAAREHVATAKSRLEAEVREVADRRDDAVPKSGADRARADADAASGRSIARHQHRRARALNVGGEEVARLALEGERDPARHLVPRHQRAELGVVRRARDLELDVAQAVSDANQACASACFRARSSGPASQKSDSTRVATSAGRSYL